MKYTGELIIERADFNQPYGGVRLTLHRPQPVYRSFSDEKPSCVTGCDVYLSSAEAGRVRFGKRYLVTVEEVDE